MSVGKPIKDIQLVFRQRGWGDDVEFGNIMDLIRNTGVCKVFGMNVI